MYQPSLEPFFLLSSSLCKKQCSICTRKGGVSLFFHGPFSFSGEKQYRCCFVSDVLPLLPNTEQQASHLGKKSKFTGPPCIYSLLFWIMTSVQSIKCCSPFVISLPLPALCHTIQSFVIYYSCLRLGSALY